MEVLFKVVGGWGRGGSEGEEGVEGLVEVAELVAEKVVFFGGVGLFPEGHKKGFFEGV